MDQKARTVSPPLVAPSLARSPLSLSTFYSNLIVSNFFFPLSAIVLTHRSHSEEEIKHQREGKYFQLSQSTATPLQYPERANCFFPYGWEKWLNSFSEKTCSSSSHKLWVTTNASLMKFTSQFYVPHRSRRKLSPRRTRRRRRVH